MQELIAPRPLRLTATPSFAFYSPSHTSSSSSFIRSRHSSVRILSSPSADAFARISLSDGNDTEYATDRDRSSVGLDDNDVPPSSPRLSPEALEEFLSILQPVIMRNPESPIMRPRLDRPYSWCHKRNRSGGSDEYRSISEQHSGEEFDQVGDEIKYDARHWHYSSILSSPVSRSHTQNPLARCVSQDIDLSSYLIRAISPRISTPSILALAQSIPIPPSPFPSSSRGTSPQTVEV
ncbi:hypothetical protein Clacol_006507 [Clathrus columnatus]|uniref:Uncharacterized protein n=1 Tax=Clathrus columnatus TaxID=1419009 RepID=A0AAV5AH23_9AGAM|nr:hypothetical protein Clacol_006507 [Clathrus columnatus]